MKMPPGTLRSRSFTRFTMRVGLAHLGQLVLLEVSITFLRSPVFAILAMRNRLLRAGARRGGIALAGHGNTAQYTRGLLPKDHPGSFRLHRNPRRRERTAAIRVGSVRLAFIREYHRVALRLYIIL